MLKNLAVRAINLAGKPFGINPIPRAFENPAGSAAADRTQAFEDIYHHNGWGSAESVSGVGSEKTRTASYVARLSTEFDRLQIRSFIDAPCGDLNWIIPAIGARRYIGGDIAPSLVAQLRQRYPDLELRVFDICRDAFPDVDAWHCRDCLFHLPLASIRLALENFAGSSIPYAFMTTHRAIVHHTNLDVPNGGFRYLDLERAPIALPRPISYIKDYRLGLDFPRYVGVWTREQVRSAL